MRQPPRASGLVACALAVYACGRIEETTLGGPVAVVKPPAAPAGNPVPGRSPGSAPAAPGTPAPAPEVPGTPVPAPAAGAGGSPTLQPPGGVLVGATRGQVRLEVGRSGAIVAMPDLPPEPGEPAECRRRGPVLALSFPIGESPAREVVRPTVYQCDGESPDPIAIVALGEEAAAIDCSFPHNLSWSCTVRAPFAPAGANRGFGFPIRSNMAVAAAGFAAFGDTIFAAVATTRSQIVGFVAPAAAEASRGLLGSGGSERTAFAVEPRSATEAAVTWWTREGAATAEEVVMTVDARPAGPAARVPVPARLVAGLRLESRREGRGDPHVVASGPGAAPSPVGGMDAAAATFGPALAEVAPGQWVLAWSEGLRRDTRIRAARFDPAARTLLGPAADVSTAGREAGWVALSGRAGHAVVLWNEKGESGWEIRAAEIR